MAVGSKGPSAERFDQSQSAQGEPQADADWPGAVDQCAALVADLGEHGSVIRHRHRLDERAHLERYRLRQ
jgi:hypothetical protein